MQPLTLRAFLRQENYIIDIFGYEAIPGFAEIKISDGPYWRTFHQDNIKILRNYGVKDQDDRELFEDDLVTVTMQHPAVTFIGKVSYLNGRVRAEGETYVYEDWNPSQIKYIGNFNLNPLVFKTPDK